MASWGKESKEVRPTGTGFQGEKQRMGAREAAWREQQVYGSDGSDDRVS